MTHRTTVRVSRTRAGARRTTLLDLVFQVARTSRDEGETVRTVLDLLESGRAELSGNFRAVPIDAFRNARLAVH